MKAFEYYQPTRIIFGKGRIKEIGDTVKQFGNKCLLVTVPEFDAFSALYERIKRYLKDAGIECMHFDGVIPNPTTDIVTAGAEIAKRMKADVIIGLGGGSSMDTAKAIAVEAANEGSAWDYLFYKKEPSKDTLPVIAVPTTSGTGSQTSPCAVITNPDKKDKSAIWHYNIFAKAAFIDPELMLTMPGSLTATTGFDAFTHNFEAYISNGTNPYVEMIAEKALSLIIKYLLLAVEDGLDQEAREAMAWADTLGGLAIASAGVTLPHGLGMQISGHCPDVAHGLSLAVTYPEFTRYTYKSAVGKFARVGRMFDSALNDSPDDEAANMCCDKIDDFLKKLGLWIGFEDLGVTKEDIRDIADDGQVLPDYLNNPRIASIEEMYEMMMRCYKRRAGK